MSGPIFRPGAVLQDNDGETVSFENLVYLNGVTEPVQEQLDEKLDKAGGTIEGSLVFEGNNGTKLSVLNEDEKLLFSVVTDSVDEKNYVNTPRMIIADNLDMENPTETQPGQLSVIGDTSLIGNLDVSMYTPIDGPGDVFLTADAANGIVRISGQGNDNKFQVLDGDGIAVLSVSTGRDSIVSVPALTVGNPSTFDGITTVYGNTTIGDGDNQKLMINADATVKRSFGAYGVRDEEDTNYFNLLPDSAAVEVCGENSETKFIVADEDDAAILRVDTVNGSVHVANFVAGTFSTDNISVVNGNIDVVDGSVGVTGGNVTVTNGAITVTDEGDTIFSTDGGVVATKNNVLDDGDGVARAVAVVAEIGISGSHIIGITDPDTEEIQPGEFNVLVPTMFREAVSIGGPGNAYNLTCSGRVISTKLTVDDIIGGSALSVDAETGTAATKYNTLDDGTGKATFNDLVATNATANDLTTGNITALNAIDVPVFSVNTTTDIVATRHNTLDDGTGIATFTDLVAASAEIGSLSTGDITAVDAGDAPVFSVNTTTKAISTANNTLDDGTGNATVGSLTTGGITTSGTIIPSSAVDIGDGTSRFGTVYAAGGNYTGNMRIGSASIVFTNDAALNSATEVPVNGFYYFTPNRITFGNGTGASFKFSKRASSTTTDLFTIADSGDITATGSATVASLSTGDASCTGAVTISGTESATKFRVLNETSPTPEAVLTVDTTADSVKTIYNTLDDGSGAATFLTATLGNTTITGAGLEVKGMGGQTCLRFEGDPFSPFDGSMHSKNNTLDDGMGGASFEGPVLINADMHVFGHTYHHDGMTVSGSESATKFRVLNETSPTPEAVLTVDTTADSVTTRYNTLDDGSGAATFLTATLGNTTITGAGLEVKDMGGQTCLRFGGDPFPPFAGSMHSKNNVLDNGSGGATFEGQVLLNGGMLASGNCAPLLDDTYELGSSLQRWHEIYATNANVRGTGSSTLLVTNGTLDEARSEILSVNGSTGTVSVRSCDFNNESDGGYGNHSSAFTVKRNNGVDVLRVDTKTLTSHLWHASVSNNLTVGGTVTISGTESATKFRVLNATSPTPEAVFTVNTTTDAVTTRNNTLDNGSGAATVTSLTTAAINSPAASTITLTAADLQGVIFNINSTDLCRVTSSGFRPTTNRGAAMGHTDWRWSHLYCGYGSFNDPVTIRPVTGNDNNTNVFQVFRYDGTTEVLGVDTVNERVRTKNIRTAGNHEPATDDTYDLGSSSLRWDDIYATNTTIQTSDANKKKDIEDLDLGLEFIEALRPRSYKMKNGASGRTHAGLIAQEVEATLPDFDKTSSDFAALVKTQKVDENNDPIPDEYEYGLRYTEFIAPLIKAIQELSAKNAVLEARIAALEAALV